MSSTFRLKAWELVNSRQPVQVNTPATKVSDYFGQYVFGKEAQKAFLSSEAYKGLQAAINTGKKISPELADSVASGMKNWAISLGATHYSHWFQPLTGSTAEKHDAFFEMEDDKALEKFKGSALAQQEPDASSFPNGGIRNTFEARGYTAWDPTSPAFIMDVGSSKTLCIPSIFISYTSEALDYKTPLLKALDAVDKAAVAVCEYFDRDVTKVVATLGAEQEYFLVDKALYNARPDLATTGRAIVGLSPAKGQQLEDHYFGSIPARVRDFMVDFETEALKLGIPIRTRHNEVAPAQFECAPSFGEVNLAADQNLLLMDVMARVAERHNFAVLFHEKPFAGINGSGKHNNWSLGTNTGKNLLSPGKRPKDNLQFLTFFVNTIKAVHTHADLLRASIASAGNDHRLGANEAPPAIISVFIGSQLTKVLEAIETNKDLIEKGDNLYMKLGIDKIPEILLDNTDRNRTSPFAFTGNKFEFRAVGSSANSAKALTVLNTIVADQLLSFKSEVDKEVEKGTKKEVAIVNILKRLIKEAKNILFEGNGYGVEWKKEAKKRGLSNFVNTPAALEAYVSKSSIALFEKHGIFNEREIEARYEIDQETYVKKLGIEAIVMKDLALNRIVPTAIEYQNILLQNIKGLKELGLKESSYASTKATVETIAIQVEGISAAALTLDKALARVHSLNSIKASAMVTVNEVIPVLEELRGYIDHLELVVADELWPLPKYRELLFLR